MREREQQNSKEMKNENKRNKEIRKEHKRMNSMFARNSQKKRRLNRRKLREGAHD